MKKKFTILLAVIVLSSSMTVTHPAEVYATSYTKDQLHELYNNNNILFYKDDDTVTTCSSLSPNGVTGSDNIEKIWNFLLSSGLTGEQAAGVMGNIRVESQFSPTRQEGGRAFPSGGWGLVQWTGGRRTSVVNALGEKHPELVKYHDPAYGGPVSPGGVPEGLPVDVNDKLLIFELQYMIEESKNRAPKLEEGQSFSGSEWEYLQQTKSIEDATVFWHDSFERSIQSRSKVIEDRGGGAKEIYERFKGSSVSSSNCSGLAGGDIQDFIKRYAWPNYRPGNKERKPEYASAVDRHRPPNGYIGATCHGGGVDCGGFVTILMRDSGWDKSYNSGNGYTGYCDISDTQANYLCTHWREIGKGPTINVADLQPGDVAMLPGHTFVYAGEMEGFEGVTAGASMCDYAPMASRESLTASGITWYRRK